MTYFAKQKRCKHGFVTQREPLEAEQNLRHHIQRHKIAFAPLYISSVVSFGPHLSLLAFSISFRSNLLGFWYRL